MPGMTPFKSAVLLATLLLAASGTLSAAPAGKRAPARGASASRAATKPSVLPFIADDYTRAVAEARARKVPLFIEAWAPW